MKICPLWIEYFADYADKLALQHLRFMLDKCNERIERGTAPFWVAHREGIGKLDFIAMGTYMHRTLEHAHAFHEEIKRIELDIMLRVPELKI